MTRGHLLLDKQKHTQALQDFDNVKSFSPKLAAGYAGAGDCFLALGNREKAIDNFNEAIKLDPDIKAKVLLKRAELYYKKMEYDLALADVMEYSTKIEDSNVDALLLLGKIQRKKGAINDSLINFEQAIKYDKDGAVAVTAMVKIAKIRLKQKDFYGAQYTLQRPAVLKITPLDSTKLDNYLALTEAVLNLFVHYGIIGFVPDKTES